MGTFNLLQFTTQSKMPSVAFINTSATTMTFGDKVHPTGLWLEELASPYYIFKEAGYEVSVCSVKGGPVPIDAGSMAEGFFTDECKKFMHDPEAIGALCHSKALADTDFSAFDIVYLTGGHGCVTDFVKNEDLNRIIQFRHAAGKVVAADCHGSIALCYVKKADGTPLVAGLKCTGFSDSEEAAVGLTDAVVQAGACLIEKELRAQGGDVVVVADWNSNVQTDGCLVTGQNPQSSTACAKAALAAASA